MDYSARARGRLLESGKLPHELLESLLGELPPSPPEVRLGARVGEDASAIDVPAGTLVVATDPITLTSEDVARLAVLVNANDIAVCGARPRWFLAVVLVPPGTSEGAVRDLFATLRGGVADVDAVLVGGHTEVTAAVNQPVVIGQMLGLLEHGALVTTAGFGPGDVVLQVQPAPIEGAAVLSREAADRLTELNPEVVAEARAALDRPGISLVGPALLAAELGAKALHDPTEGGLSVALHEMAAAAGAQIVVDREAVLWFAPGFAVCRALGCDPWSTLASGTLLAIFRFDDADAAVEAFRGERYDVAKIGVVESGQGVRDTQGRALHWPDRDEVARFLDDR